VDAGNRRILIVEDDAGIALLERRALERRGYAAAAAATPEEAFERLREPGRFDLAILDFRLSGPESGLDLYRRLRAEWPELPAILVTGFSDEGKVIEALRAGFRDVLPKTGNYLEYLPFAVERVLKLVDADRQLAESEALRESEERFRLATEAMSGFVYDWDVRSRQVRRFGRVEEIIGDSPPDAMGEDWRARLHPDDREAALRACFEALAGTVESYSLEYRVRHRDGHYVDICDRGRILRDAAGRAVRVVGGTDDISARRRAEDAQRETEAILRSAAAELKRMKEVAESANRAKDHFLAVLSHELRTPLTPVLTTVQLLERRDGLPAELREPLAMIRRNVALEARLIDDLLDLTRIARGKLELFFQPVDVHELLREALEICAPDIQAKRIGVTTELLAGRSRVQADPARLQQVFWNLVKNAVKFTPDGGHVTIATGDGADGTVQVRIADTGIGIAAGKLPRIFDAFEQGGQDVTRLFGGLGLGLAISKALVDLHGGTIAGESAGQGLGATFTLTFAAVPPGSLDASPLSPPAAEAHGAAGLHILLVEDHADTREALADLLQMYGHDVQAAGSVAAALEAVAAARFDLVVSDLGLPDGSGLDLMPRIRALVPYGIQGICLTGYGMEEDIRKSREAGFLAHLTKPVNFQELAAVLGRIAAAEPSSPRPSSPCLPPS
jgi:PAS domain S-box-containing protein